MRVTTRPPTANDPFDLERFVEAQQPVYAQALAELQAGRKRGHWSWFILPQLRGLGASDMSIHYGITGLAEAIAYLDHPLLEPRLAECVDALNAHAGQSAAAILGPVDAQKFHSCATLFALVDRDTPPVFEIALDTFFNGRRDGATEAMLGLN